MSEKASRTGAGGAAGGVDRASVSARVCHQNNTNLSFCQSLKSLNFQPFARDEEVAQ